MVRILYIIGLCALALPAFAAENIVLKTGFTLAADRHEVNGDTIRIFSGDGVTEMPVIQVASVDPVESPKAEAPVGVVADPLPPTPVPAPAVAKPAPVPSTPVEIARTAARKYDLPDAFVAGVMRTESGFNPAAVSPKGAIGLMQLMPDTARTLGVDPKNPNQNADAGARYLRDLLARYENQPDQVVLALAAYNAGPAAVDKYHGVPPYRETREYILRVLKAWNPPAVTPPVPVSGSKESSK
jgi:hypothetical protein